MSASVKLLGSKPLWLLVAAAFAFVCWIGYDAIQASQQGSPKTQPEYLTDEAETPAPEALLASIHYGMPRPVVEKQLAGLPNASPDPMETVDGSRAMRSRYYVNLVTPIPHMMGRPPHEFRPGTFLLTVEYDGGIPHNPVIRAELSAIDAN
jgi:hypothetical protein